MGHIVRTVGTGTKWPSSAGGTESVGRTLPPQGMVFADWKRAGHQRELQTSQSEIGGMSRFIWLSRQFYFLDTTVPA